MVAAKFDIVPEGKKRALSFSNSVDSLFSRRWTVGSSPKTSSPTSASNIAVLIAGDGLVTVSLLRSIGFLLEMLIENSWQKQKLSVIPVRKILVILRSFVKNTISTLLKTSPSLPTLSFVKQHKELFVKRREVLLLSFASSHLTKGDQRKCGSCDVCEMFESK
jgi:hypothetical protein